jgi:hypothetical protein
LRRRRLGNSGSITAHKSSSISGFGIAHPRVNAMPYRTKSIYQSTDPEVHFVMGS